MRIITRMLSAWLCVMLFCSSFVIGVSATDFSADNNTSNQEAITEQNADAVMHEPDGANGSDPHDLAH